MITKSGISRWYEMIKTKPNKPANKQKKNLITNWMNWLNKKLTIKKKFKGSCAQCFLSFGLSCTACCTFNRCHLFQLQLTYKSWNIVKLILPALTLDPYNPSHPPCPSSVKKSVYSITNETISRVAFANCFRLIIIIIIIWFLYVVFFLTWNNSTKNYLHIGCVWRQICLFDF